MPAIAAACDGRRSTGASGPEHRRQRSGGAEGGRITARRSRTGARSTSDHHAGAPRSRARAAPPPKDSRSTGIWRLMRDGPAVRGRLVRRERTPRRVPRPIISRAADELVRVTRPGGRLGLIDWPPEGFIGQMFATMKPYAHTSSAWRPASGPCGAAEYHDMRERPSATSRDGRFERRIQRPDGRRVRHGPEACRDYCKGQLTAPIDGRVSIADAEQSTGRAAALDPGAGRPRRSFGYHRRREDDALGVPALHSPAGR